MNVELIRKSSRQVHRIRGYIYAVRSDRSSNWYEVALVDCREACDCPSFKYRDVECRHTRMVKGSLDSEPAPEPAPEPVRVRPVADDTCPRCGAISAKSGRRRNKSHVIQRYLCRACGLRFLGNYGFEGQRAGHETVADAINLHLDGGMSSRKIQRHLKRHGLRFSHVSVRNWINKYSSLQTEYLDSLLAKPGRR